MAFQDGCLRVVLPCRLVHLQAFVVVSVEQVLHLGWAVRHVALLVLQGLLHSVVESFALLLVNQGDQILILTGRVGSPLLRARDLQVFLVQLFLNGYILIGLGHRWTNFDHAVGVRQVLALVRDLA